MPLWPARAQSEIDASLVPVAERLVNLFKAAQDELKASEGGSKQAKAAKDHMDALVLFKGDIATYVRLYAFLSQIFDYGNTDIEKRSIFFKLLHRLLDFGRETQGLDLSSLAMTHYSIKDMGRKNLILNDGKPTEKIDPTNEPGTGKVQDKQKQSLEAIIANGQ